MSAYTKTITRATLAASLALGLAAAPAHAGSTIDSPDQITCAAFFRLPGQTKQYLYAWASGVVFAASLGSAERKAALANVHIKELTDGVDRACRRMPNEKFSAAPMIFALAAFATKGITD